MKFKFCHDPERKTLAIPRAALQLSKLAEAEELTIHTESGCVLVTRDDLSAGETVGVIQLLSDLNVSLISQLAEASREASDETNHDIQAYTHGLSIPAALLDQAGIAQDEPLDVQAEEGQIIITTAEEDLSDSFDDVDDSVLEMLSSAGVDLSGLHMLLEQEAEQDE